MKKVSSFLTLIAFGTAATAQQTVTFDNASDFTDGFTTTGSTWTHQGSFGNPAPGVQSGATSGYATQNETFTLDLSQDQSFSISIDFLTSFNVFNSSNNSFSLSLGFTDASSVSSVDASRIDNTSIWAGLVPTNGGGATGFPNDFAYHFGQGDTLTGIQTTTGTIADNLAQFTTYNLTVNFTYTDATNEFSAQTVLAGGSTVNFAGTITNPWGADDTIEMHAFFGGYNVQNGGVWAVDNFTSPIPEPSAYTLIAGFMALGWIMLRRRK